MRSGIDAGQIRLPGGRFFFRLAVSILFPIFLSGAQQKASETQTPAKAEEAKPAGPPTYVGAETCQPCHEDIFNGIQKNPHHVLDLDKKRGWAGKVCESCHGPGSKHAESMAPADIRNPARLKPGAADQVCLTCHANTPTHVGRLQNAHARNGVSCVGCHSVHKAGPEGMVPQKAATINQLCAGCHIAQWASFQKPYKHRLPEGAMSCTDCHDPHGSFSAKMIQTVFANDRGCFKCHGDKRGPFTFEHAPVRVEGCGACHEPHGSANPKMLIRAEVRFVCLECHANLGAPAPNPAKLLGGVVPPAFHDLRIPRFQNCTLCHVKVHGSYVDRDLTR
jgi:DmsE family decaheme c-type cytochrome